MATTANEDYIKTIYALESSGQRASTSRIAQRLDVTMASVTGKIKHLAAAGYVRHTPYYGVTLTPKGRKLALHTLRRHRLIELFLVKTLGLRWDEVHADAEVLEHAISDKVLERMYEYLGRPEFDPHGAPIPAEDGSIKELTGVRLSDLPSGARSRVLHVSDADGEFLRYLASIDFTIGTAFTLRDRAPYGGPLRIRIGRRELDIGPDAAERILVCPS
ncbi:MAG: metal-dependent transcriptional regulator [Phycisphaerales bacterium]|nr:metal-dependent transcriptional regulator [Phycisphaerales bacterium]